MKMMLVSGQARPQQKAAGRRKGKAAQKSRREQQAKNVSGKATTSAESLVAEVGDHLLAIPWKAPWTTNMSLSYCWASQAL